MNVDYVTKDGIEVKPGQQWRDLDKRMPVRVVVILELLPKGRVLVQHRVSAEQGHTSGKTKLSVRRMHRHSTGFELVK